MKYMGSKNRIAKEILPIILKDRYFGQWWVEPFVGGGNMIDKVCGPRIGSDINIYAIEALRAIQNYANRLPKNNKEFTEEDYKRLRYSDDYEFKGFAGFAYSFGAKWMGGWSRSNTGRDYVKEAYLNANKQQKCLTGVILVNKSYDELTIPAGSLIYCDPPYSTTTGYKHEFDTAKFWDWCLNMATIGHDVFVSELDAPDSKRIDCVWEGIVKNTIHRGQKKGKDQKEKLFKVAK